MKASVLLKHSRGAAYTMAAAAATGAIDAQAEVIYSGPQDIAIGQFASQELNLDGDAYNDILLKNYIFDGGNYQGATVDFAPGQLVGFSANGIVYASALSPGSVIDGTTVGPSFYGSMAYGANNPNGEFDNAVGAFLGLSFPINATNHYGWVRVTIDNAAGTFVINDWAYEDQQGVGIQAGDTGVQPILGDFNDDQRVDGADFLEWQRGVGTLYNAADLADWQANFGTLPGSAAPAAHTVPEPGTLGLLAAGAAGVSLLRRRRSKS
ncbi:MAG: PEP-CTERM sorting domain-containing protein [Planctomycetales bacterium]|nr:PEP-CTERM sorting domain-containing protein [Planctomycetales bacterium]